MRIWLLVLGVVGALVGLAGTSHAKRLACSPPIAPDQSERQPAHAQSAVVHGVTFSSAGVWISAEVPHSAVRVRLTYTDGADHVELWTTPQRMFACIPRVPSAPHSTAVYMFDADGKAYGSAVSATVERRRYRCGLGAMMFLVLIPIGLIALAVLAFVRSALRRRKLKRPGEALSPLVSETMIRALITDTLVVITAGFTLSTLLYASHDFVYAGLVAWIPITRLFRLIAAHRLLRRLEGGEPAHLHDNLVATLTNHVAVPRSIIRSALQRGVPAAKIRTI